jgi:hypothetical protein
MNQSEESCEAATTALEAPSNEALRVACYCEENVWRLAHCKLSNNPDENTYYVVFVSNKQECVAMWHQIAAHKGPNSPVFWDYHVYLMETCNANETTVVLDLDSHLPYPCPFDEYITQTFQTDMEQYAPLFRVVEASVYLKHFSSDRSHMYNDETRTWSAPPPTYACIQAAGEEATNLKKYIGMTERRKVMGRTELLQLAKEEKYGVTMSLAELEQVFHA